MNVIVMTMFLARKLLQVLMRKDVRDLLLVILDFPTE